MKKPQTYVEGLVDISMQVTEYRLKAAGVTLALKSLGLPGRKISPKNKLSKRQIEGMAGPDIIRRKK
jgi:hypothetical protein